MLENVMLENGMPDTVMPGNGPRRARARARRNRRWTLAEWMWGWLASGL